MFERVFLTSAPGDFGVPPILRCPLHQPPPPRVKGYGWNLGFPVLDPGTVLRSVKHHSGVAQRRRLGTVAWILNLQPSVARFGSDLKHAI